MSEEAVCSSIKRTKSSAEVIQQFNSINAKIVAALVVVGVLCYHGMLKITNGSDSCQWLLTKGRYQGDRIWQPYGCMLHSYSSIDANQCLRYIGYLGQYNSVAFVGDSRVRQLYFAVLKHIDPKAEPVIRDEPDLNDRPLDKAHSDLHYNSTHLHLKLSFYWRPMVDENMYSLLESWLGEKHVPMVLITGSGTWSIKSSNGSVSALEMYASNLTTLARIIDQWPNNNSRILWMLQDPVNSEKLSPERQMIQNDIINLYNEQAVHALRHSRFQIWYSARLVSEQLGYEENDGLHLGPVALKHDLQILLNMYCNDWMNFHDGTCCSTAKPATTLQLVTFTVLLLCFVMTVAWLAIQSFRRRRKRRHLLNAIETRLDQVDEPETKKHLLHLEAAHHVNGSVTKHLKIEPSWQVLIASLGRLGLIMVYFYLCDRTNYFMKENRYYSHLNFWLPIGYVFALGLFFTEESRYTKMLHRDQTDEWKGWMQLVILIYHMTGASQIIPLYMQIRVLVSAYLFLTGYGHFCYFWHSGNGSFVRLCQVLFRMNLMTVVTCLCMNRPYQFYYFVPLVSFWYLVVYITLILPRRVTAPLCEANPVYYLYVVLKFIGLFACITILYMSEVFFAKIFTIRPWKAIFVTSDDEIHEWWFRWSLDRYSICYGMVFGFLHLCAQKYGLIDDHSQGNLWTCCRSFVVAILSILGLGFYIGLTFTCRNKPECNEVHPYVVFVPIISFVLLRNISGLIRTRYSSFFAWFGRISLELFIGQYHIWLAADTHGILVLIPNYPVINVIVTSFILVCVAHEIHHITYLLLPLAVPSDWKRSLRNVVLFFLALVPIAIHDGMF